MSKHLALITTLALATAFGLAGCKSKTEGKPADQAAAKPDETKPAEAKPSDEAKPAATGGLPAECDAYKAAIEKLATCSQLPQETRDAFKQAFDEASKGWAAMPADERGSLSTMCNTAVASLSQMASICN